MTVKRAYFIAYILMLPLLFCWVLEGLGTLGDGATSTSRYIIPFWGNLCATIQLNFLVSIWRNLEIPKFNFRILLHLILALPFLISVARIPIYMFKSFNSNSLLLQLVILIVVNLALAIYLNECYWIPADKNRKKCLKKRNS